MNPHPPAIGILSVLGLLGLLGWVFRKKRRLAGWSRASGIVVALRSQGRRCLAPVVHFDTGDAREFTHRSTTGSNPPGFTVGEAVVVLYDPVDPSRAVIPTFFQLWFGECFVTLALVVGLVFSVLIGLGIVR